ncbi:MAG: GGDEF domain-containing protein [Bacteroidetes bacterium]|nr:GGDEF domain-containing protein [Bacteroidota bacterium]
MKDITEALGLSYAGFYELNNKGNEYILTNTNDKSLAIDNLMAIPGNSQLIETLCDQESYLYLEHLNKKAGNETLLKVFADLKISLCFPVFDHTANTLTGILVYGGKLDKALFSLEDLQILNNIIKEAENKLNIIVNISFQILKESKVLNGISDLKYFSIHATKIIQHLLNVKETNIYLFDEDKHIYFNPLNKDAEPIQEDNYLVKYLTEKKEIILSTTLEKWSDEVQLKELVEVSEAAKKLNASIIAPLLDFSQTLGLITISKTFDREKKYSQSNYLLLSFIIDKIQNTLANIYANKKANIDVLTGFHNRIFLSYRLETEINRSLKEEKALSFLLIDVDGFKFFNDAGGHDEGDIVLEQVSSAIRDLIRPSDECFRFGGDEFSIIIPDTDNDNAYKVANRLMEGFNNHANNQYLESIFGSKVTLSISVTTYDPKNGGDECTVLEILAIIDILIKKAEMGLSDAKKKGKGLISIMPSFGSVKYAIDLNKEPKPLRKKYLPPIDPFDLERFKGIEY